MPRPTESFTRCMELATRRSIPKAMTGIERFVFFSDVPHLIKTTRNCFSNSFAHANTRGMWVSFFSLHSFSSVKSACTNYRRMGSILVGHTWRDYMIETRGENKD